MHGIAVSFSALLLPAACSNPSVQEDERVVYSVDADDGDALMVDDTCLAALKCSPIWIGGAGSLANRENA